MRKEGTAISGKISGIDENEKIESALAVVHSAVLPPGERAMFAPSFDAVDVKNGVVRLTGTTPTGARRLEVAVLARSIQGVRAVEDDLRLMTAKR